MKMENLHIDDISCFGFSIPKKDSWFNQLHAVSSRGWKNIDFDKFQQSLSDNVEASYYRLVGVSFTDLDTDIKYYASFNNNLKKWTLEIPDSPKEAVLEEDKDAFFKSETFKNTCKRAYDIMSQALKSCESMLVSKVENGDFLEVDEIKLEAIVHMLKDQILMKNLKLGKYEK